MNDLDPDLVIVVGACVVAGVRAVSAHAAAALRVPGWPVVRCGPAAVAVVLHDVLTGVAAVVALGTLGGWAAEWLSLGPAFASGVALVTVLAGLATSGAILRRRRGIGFRALFRPRHRVVEPCRTVRGRLLDATERAGVRGVSRWITHSVNRTLRRSGATAEQLLPAVWPAARLRLREAPGLPRTEVALLLLQAQAVMEDASPPIERMFTLLHLVHGRAGRRGVRGVLEHARRSPVRHGRSGAAAWAASPQAVPRPVPSQRTVAVADAVADEAVDSNVAANVSNVAANVASKALDVDTVDAVEVVKTTAPSS